MPDSHSHASARFLRPYTTALIVVDMQQKLMPVIADARPVIGSAKKLLAAAQILNVPTLLTTQYEKGLGSTVPEIAAASVGVETIDKTTFGCFGSQDFRDTLAARRGPGSTLILAGVEAHICVMQTALGAIEAGYSVHIAVDAVGSRTPEDRLVGLERMRDAGAVLTSAETAIYELLEDSSREEFKRMLPILK